MSSGNASSGAASPIPQPTILPGKSKPATSKGVFLRKVAVSSTMGIGVRVDAGTLQAAAQG